MLAAAVLADVITPYGFAQTNLRERFIAMSASHWLGTDQLGRDLLTRIIYGARVSLYVGFGAVALGSVLATALGIVSAYFGGRIDLWLQRGVDAWMAFPGLLLLMSIMSLLGPSVVNITAVLGVAFGIQNSRIIRGVALSIKEHTFVEGARAAGSGHTRIAITHILPNVMPTIIVVATTGLSTVILTEASLSFLGLGVPPPYPTWGGMLSLAGPRPHVPGPVDGHLAGGGAVARRLRLQHAGRRPARPARPAPRRAARGPMKTVHRRDAGRSHAAGVRPGGAAPRAWRRSSARVSPSVVVVRTKGRDVGAGGVTTFGQTGSGVLDLRRRAGGDVRPRRRNGMDEITVEGIGARSCARPCSRPTRPPMSRSCSSSV